MKNSVVIILFSIKLFYLTSCSCDDNKKSEKTSPPITPNSQTQQEQNIVTIKTDTISIDVPTFNDPEVQKYVEDYTAYMKEYLAAVKSKDITNIAQLGMESQKWKTKGEAITQRLSYDPDELKKYNDYMVKLYEKMKEIMSS